MQEPSIVYEDNHLLALFKPAGMPSQADQTGDLSAFDWAKAYVKARYNKPGEAYMALLHRLDRPVSGLLLLAKTSKAAARMTEQFKKRELQKAYWAIVARKPPATEGELLHYLRKHPHKNVVKAHPRPVPDGQEARLKYSWQKSIDGLHLLRVEPLTGRQHQIRVQLAEMGCPVLGDVKYGADAPLEDRSIALCSAQLEIVHPTTQAALKLQAPWPAGRPWSAFGKAGR